MAKTVTFDVEARQHLKKGIDTVAQAVRITLGPKGRNVVLEKKFGAPTITNDGVTIAREIEVEDVFENQGAQLVREVATATNDVAGDGTTTATVLAQAIVREGLKNVAAGANPMALKRGIEAAVGAVVDGIHAAGMLSAAKHFPGHGDTTVSSETRLPRIDASLATLRARELPPFQSAIAHGTDFVLLGHLFYPALDPKRSADLSPATVTLLRSELGFKGAILSDDMEMGAITSSTPTPEAAVEFLIADSVRLVSESVPDDWLAQIIPYRSRCRGLVW